MARIRSIKPGFWSDEKLSPESDSCRLLFIALWSMADDFGRLIDSEKQIEAFVYPDGDHSRVIRESLARLSRLGRIRRGLAANGQRIIEIVNWRKHQLVDRPSAKAALPEIVELQLLPEPSRDPRESLASPQRDPRETFATPKGGGGGSGEELKAPSPPAGARGREAFLAAIPTASRRERWRAAIGGWRDGMGTPNGKPFTDEQIDGGLTEYLAAVDDPDFSPQHVIRFVIGMAGRAPNAHRRGNGTGETSEQWAERHQREREQGREPFLAAIADPRQRKAWRDRIELWPYQSTCTESQVNLGLAAYLAAVPPAERDFSLDRVRSCIEQVALGAAVEVP